MVKIRDLIAAEEELEAAEAEFRRYNDDAQQWSAFESLDKHGKRHLNLMPGHFERRDALLQAIRARHIEMRALRAQFLADAGVQLGPQTGSF